MADEIVIDLNKDPGQVDELGLQGDVHAHLQSMLDAEGELAVRKFIYDACEQQIALMRVSQNALRGVVNG